MRPPARRPDRELVPKQTRDLFVQRGVLRVSEPVKVASPPPRDEIDPDVDCRRDTTDDRQREAVEMSPFDPRDRRCRDVYPRAQVRLAPPTFDPNAPHCWAEPLIVHGTQSRDRRLLAAYRLAQGRSCA